MCHPSLRASLILHLHPQTTTKLRHPKLQQQADYQSIMSLSRPLRSGSYRTLRHRNQKGEKEFRLTFQAAEEHGRDQEDGDGVQEHGGAWEGSNPPLCLLSFLCCFYFSPLSLPYAFSLFSSHAPTHPQSASLSLRSLFSVVASPLSVEKCSTLSN